MIVPQPPGVPHPPLMTVPFIIIGADVIVPQPDV
jgi:hypothetical protein